MRRLSQLLMLVVLLVSTSLVWADGVQIDPNSLPPDAVKKLYELKNQAEEVKKQAAEKATSMTEKVIQKVPSAGDMEKYTNIGVSVAKAIGATCRELNVEVNAFVQTPVGKLTMFIIAYKVIGAGFLKGIAATIAWVVIMILSWKSYKKFFVPERVVDKDGNVKYIEPYEFSSGDAKSGSLVLNILIPVGMTILWIVII